jgi:RNA polymerase sigma-70 factor (ECF subfamily)
LLDRDVSQVASLFPKKRTKTIADIGLRPNATDAEIVRQAWERQLTIVTGNGDDFVDQQDRSLWNQDQISEGIALTEHALASRRFSAYTLQAAIAALHAEASSSAVTDWRQIAMLYGQLFRIQPSPVVELNRAVAVAMSEHPKEGLRLIDGLLARGELASYYLAHSARADLCRRLGRHSEARASYERALALAPQEPERRFLAARLRELQ